MGVNISEGFDSIKEERIRYYNKYTFDCPIVMSIETFEEMRKLGLIIHRAIIYMIEHYRDFQDLMPRTKRELEILKICEQYQMEAGSFRTDFVIGTNNQLKIIEMGTRHLLDGYFMSGSFHEIGMNLAKKLGIKDVVNIYPRFFTYLEECIGNAPRICIVKGNDRLEEMAVYLKIFNAAGLEVIMVPIENIQDQLDMLNGAFLIGELTLEEIHSLSDEVIHILAAANIHNPIQTVLTTHDKRFFYVMGESEFTNQFLTADEKKILMKYLVPTFIPGKNHEHWEAAYHNKDAYILKHRCKGRSENVYAGCITSEDVWKQLFDSGEINEMVLQNFIIQKKFNGTVDNEKREDYVTGTLLYYNQEFFGPGVYRTSSIPVSNIIDYRKAAQLVAKADIKKKNLYYL
ncbi:MAG: hypothetical protein WCO13_08790 [Bacteroidota bacterium]